MLIKCGDNMNELFYNQMFENRMYTCFGYEFQHFVFQIMKTIYKDKFIMPKPQGRLGDKKNDGFIPSKGEYYGIYGPETNDLDINYTLSKLEKDFIGLFENIKNGEWKFELKKYIFVINTRNNATFPVSIVQKAEELSKKYSVEVCLWGSYEVKQLFEKLTLRDKMFILQCYVVLDNISLNLQVLNQLIYKINSSNYSKSMIDGFMKFENKIKFNNLSENRAADLLSASFNINALDSALNELDSTGVLQEQLAYLLKTTYDEGKTKCENENQIFDYLIEKLMEECSDKLESINFKVVRETVLIVVSKYFENCTIFEKEKGEEV